MTGGLYIVGFGANIAPERNVTSAISALLARFGEVHVSRIARTAPVGVPGGALFLNGALAFQSPLKAEDLKDWFNALETAHGRDRTSPDSKILPRPLDLDILHHIEGSKAPRRDSLPQDSYIRPFVEDLLAHLDLTHRTAWDPPLDCVALIIAGHRVGERSVTLRSPPSPSSPRQDCSP
ncbi:MAG: 2-amino-4-hydroxy-6-hydroxymethyldihydropteridine diphosphokinase [Rhodospirillum sp.]|nr:2-amino-4-hydroxy-6-hydroxymethyldihydropteridine diphosphokinase [Rhodospirillum sp.]MCF8489403.1 2-amino-4-hydroxy-6-hydroxymethyldihydropteridine diphosphokinase [Rhodospirillum sp.]MCF8503055.1 2-amino-4-hydroxy-6-hydroxymethyldihydropteridine diphosphokinase [Rhodospirillum sp.]